ncbi:unnamed protein product [Chondrus crispus]|uniref:Tyrosyl-DNA phosphodiesterase n=1 Tax=Chondrus crispus TaxID=2769 RepID=R7Q7T1_CHOCR|nr:unnamed protein product [Chondrus crispus]CDF34084.1 unnamed protein product [Chondrus crispus]|eukprot:XP_005713903.1 unnamed protein product [Chondrus crispus]
MSANGNIEHLHGDLSRFLRAFLAQARFGTVTSTLWNELQRKLVSALPSESAQTITSALHALHKERGCTSCAEWSALKHTVNDTLQHCERSQLVHSLQEKGLSNNGEDSSKLTPKKRAAPGDDSFSLQPRKRKPDNSNKSILRDDVVIVSDDDETVAPRKLYGETFCILRSEANIHNKKHTVALDEIVTAGADFTVVCNYNFDVSWMWEAAPALQTSRKVLIVHGETPEEERDWKSFINGVGASERVRFVRPRTPPYGTVHSKMFLQFFPNGCRICIHTANMVPRDWYYKVQGAYVRDFPLINQGTDLSDSHVNMQSPTDEDDFKTQLDRYFRHALVGDAKEEVTRSIAKYDFSSAGVALIASVPGVHKGPAKMHFGHARLRELLKSEAFTPEDSGSVAVCQFSSLGSIQQKWLEEEFKETLFSEAAGPSSQPANAHSTEIKLVYPTAKQVQESIEGKVAGASIPVRGKNLHRGHIVNKLHRWQGKHSGYERAMPHIKTVLRYPVSRPQSPFWVFLGSFNLSVAAWGRMQGGKKGKKVWDRLNLLAYEVGVLFTAGLACPPNHSVDASIKYARLTASEVAFWRQAKRDRRLNLRASTFGESAGQNDNMPSNDGAKVVLNLPIPYQLPPAPYSDADTPWIVDYLMM